MWTQIAPTGEDWDEKLLEIPAAAARPLAISLLRAGNFACPPPAPAPAACPGPAIDLDPPAHAATLADPCLRRMLALWALAQLEPADVGEIPGLRDALRGIAALPPPESQLVAAALAALPEADAAGRLELLGIAWRAGQRELVNGSLGGLDEAALIAAVRVHRIDGALEVLSATGHRAVYLAALTDDLLAPAARVLAARELIAGLAADPLPAELRRALVTAAGAADCGVAAAAARALAEVGDRRFVPRRPRSRTPATMMRALCVLASYELAAPAEEPSLLAGFLPARGLERVNVSYDALSEADTDGDGDVHTETTAELVAPGDAVLPEVEDLVRAMRACRGTTCSSADRSYRFGLRPGAGGLVLARLELVERPPCGRP